MANDITTEDQEMGGAMKLSKSAIRRAYWDWMFYNLSVQNFERMQGPAIIKMLADVREDLYPGDPEAQQEMLEPRGLLQHRAVPGQHRPRHRPWHGGEQGRGQRRDLF